MLEWLYATDYWYSRLLLQRALGVIYCIAFLNAANQFPALCGENGLLPISRILNRISFKRSPSIFHWHYSDRFFRFIAWSGVLLSLVAVTGMSESGPLWLSMLTWFLLWALYLSIVNVGQTFYGFGWESMLSEIGFFAIFLGPSHMAAPVLVIWIIRWMLFRVEFGAGLIKIRGDRCWRKLTCLNYHHETQPLPNPLSWFFHHLPESLHKVETGFNHFVQLVAVWGLFFPQPVASVSAAVIIISQLYLVISGNYSWLNWLTLSLAFSGISDGILQQYLNIAPPPESSAMPAYFQGLIGALTVWVIYLSIKPVQNMISPHQMMNFSFNPLHLVNTYGAFGSVTKKRYEIVIEGTRDREINAETDWKEYDFKGKPGDPRKVPIQVSPYHLRIDWQMWFAAMSSYHRHPWFPNLVKKLLKGDVATLKLLRHNPFPDSPPRYVRAVLYRYEYSSFKELKESGRWWNREYVQSYLSPRSLEEHAGL